MTPYNGLTLSITAGSTGDKVTVNNTTNSSNASFKVATTLTVATTGYGILATTSTDKTYYAEGSEITSTLSATGSSIAVVNGTATVTQGSNSVKVADTATGTITVTYGENGVPTVANAGDAAITLVTGVIGSETTKLSPSETLKDFVELGDGTNNYYSAQILASVGNPAVTIKTAAINGNVVQKASVGDAKVLEASEGITLPFATGSTYTINSNVNVYVYDITEDNSNVKLFGSLYSKETVGDSTALSGKIGPSGYYSSNITFANNTENTNVTSADAEDFEIAGEPNDSPRRRCHHQNR